MNAPANLQELKRFYKDEFRPLYDRFTVKCNGVPHELHAEVSAAFDHILRGPDDALCSAEDFARASGHLKRATFDAFKILFESARRVYDKLNDSKYRDVEDGNFLPRISRDWKELCEIAVKARTAERPHDYDSWSKAFDEWKKILPFVDSFEALQNDEKIVRVDRASSIDKIKSIGINLLYATISALIGYLLGKYC